MTTDNRTNEPTEAQVEAAARALADADNHFWSALSDRMREKFRGYARAALTAAESVAPQAESDDCPTPGNHRAVRQVSESDLAEVIWERATRRTSLGFSINSRDGAAEIASAVVAALGGETPSKTV